MPVNIPNLLASNWYWILGGIVALIILIRFLPRYKIAPPDTALIISGLFRHRYKVREPDGSITAKKFGYRIVRGGSTFFIPAIERIDKLDMCLMQVDIKTSQPVPTKEYIAVNVDAVANIKIGSDELSIATAAEQLLHYDADQIKALAKDVLEGNMREIIGQMTIAELVQNRDKFAQESIKAAMSDMSNMGLEIINMTIQNFSDDEGIIINMMSVQNKVDKKRDADIAQAEAERDSRIAQAEAKQLSQKAEIEAQAFVAEQSKELALREARYKEESDRAKAVADMAYEIEKERVRKTFEEEHAAAELTRLERETELNRQSVEVERERLSVEIREKADAELYRAQKEAEAIRLKGQAEADALRMKAEAMQLYGQAAMLEMIADKLPDIARAVSEPLSKTEKIILFGEGGATSMAKDTAGTMLQTFTAVKDAVGLDIPKMLTDVSTGGLVGKAGGAEKTAPLAE